MLDGNGNDIDIDIDINRGGCMIHTVAESVLSHPGPSPPEN